MTTSKIIFAFFILIYSTSSIANVVGADHQNFNPTTNGIDFVTVQSGQTLDPGILNFGIFLNYAANTLSFLESANPVLIQNKKKLNDRLLSSDFNFGLGLMKNWDIGFSFPYLLRQDIDNTSQVAYFDSTGNTEQRFNTKYRFFQSGEHSWAAVFSVNRNAIENNPYTGQDPGLILNFELATSWKAGNWWYGINAGHRWRNQGRSLASVFSIDPIPNQYIASIAASRYITAWNLKWIIESYGSMPSEKTGSNLSNRDYSNLELLSGLKWDATENMAWHAGLATELMQGFGTPDYRIYIGLNYAMGPLWRQAPPPQPAPPVASASKPQPPPETRTFTLTNLKFKFDSDILEESSLPELDEVVLFIRELQTYVLVEVEGHTDSLGNDSYNLRLSQKRADAIRKKLISILKGDARKFKAEGFGETKPIADNSNYQGRAQNRRVVVTVHTKYGKYKLSLAKY